MSKARSLRPGSFGTLWYFAAAIALAVAMMSCGGKGSPSETAAPAANPAAKPVDAATAGTVTGSIKLDGTAPKPRNINMAAEPNCATQHSTPAQTEDVVPGDGGRCKTSLFISRATSASTRFLPRRRR